jgi:ATP-dependent Lon protease
LAVGGVREKALAALRAGVKTVIVPEPCMRDVDDIPKELKRQLEFVPVKTMRQVLDAALEEPPSWPKDRPKDQRKGRPAPSALPAALSKKQP